MAEMLILSGIVQAGNLVAFTLMCTMLTIIFVATGRTPNTHGLALGAGRVAFCPQSGKFGLWVL